MQTILKHAKVIRKEWPESETSNPAGKKLWVVDARPHGRREGYPTEQDALTRAEERHETASERLRWTPHHGGDGGKGDDAARIHDGFCPFPFELLRSLFWVLQLLDAQEVDRLQPGGGICTKVKNGEVRILSVPQATALLRAAMASHECSYTVPFATISVFAGLRPGEVEHLR